MYPLDPCGPGTPQAARDEAGSHRAGSHQAGDTACAPPSAPAVVTVDLAALTANYRRLRQRLRPEAECGAVLKADAYGLGAAGVAPALAAAGARWFFVAHLDEALALRPHVPAARIAVLNGALPGTEPEFARHGLLPVLNDPGAIERWSNLAQRMARALPALLQFDTGMARLGLSAGEAAHLAEAPDRLSGIDVTHAMTHFACADEPDHPLNAEQLACFERLRAGIAPALKSAKTSLANSAALFLPAAFHGDLARPGAALYGLNPRPGGPNPMLPVVTVHGRILQVRDVAPSTTVGYGATFRAAGPRRVATVAVGYADGHPWSLGNRGSVFVAGLPAPIIGRISMDLITVDVTDLPSERCAPGALVELIGPNRPADQIATEAGTIGYEILVRLGPRYHRVYRNAPT